MALVMESKLRREAPMRLFTAAVLLIAGALAAQTPPPSEDWKVWLERGTREFKQARYAEAAESFEKAVALRPEEVQPHLYLGTAWMNQYIPGAATPENVRYAQRAETEFRAGLEKKPNPPRAPTCRGCPLSCRRRG